MSKTKTVLEPESLEALLERLEIEEWDMILVGDGSGSKWGYPIGWGCVAILPDEMQRFVFFGGMNQGTVNIAEMMAYMAPMLWYLARDKNPRQFIRHIHVITDSDYVRRRGEGDSLDFKKNQPLWTAFAMFQRQGYEMHWHHIHRDTAALNMYADILSKEARKQVKYGDVLTNVYQAGFDPETSNPWE